MTLEAHFFFPINEDRVIFYRGFFFFYCNFIYKLFQTKINFAIDKDRREGRDKKDIRIRQELEFIICIEYFVHFFFFIASSFFFYENKNLKLCYSVFGC